MMTCVCNQGTEETEPDIYLELGGQAGYLAKFRPMRELVS